MREQFEELTKKVLAGLWYLDYETGEIRHPATLDEWIDQRQNRAVVELTRLIGCKVSTVFLGLDPDEFMPFESMILGGEFDGRCRQYQTLAEARIGHEEIVGALRDGQEP